MEYNIAPTAPRTGAEGSDFNPVDVWAGPNYTFHFNDGTGLGDLLVGQHKIGLADTDARMFATADEPTRQALLVRFVQAHEARIKARRAAPK